MQDFTIVVPVYNEAQILFASIRRLHRELRHRRCSIFEIILAENGSTDETRIIADRLSRSLRRVRVVSLLRSNFGDAFKCGAQKAKYPQVVLFNADWWSVAFLKKSLRLLQTYAIVVGSKQLVASRDRRPLLRKLGTALLTAVLRLLFHYPGTDTHGIKAFRKQALMTLLSRCVTHEIIESELLIRAKHLGLPIKEIPVSIREVRPSRLSFLRRCSLVAKELVYLYGKLHVG